MSSPPAADDTTIFSHDQRSKLIAVDIGNSQMKIGHFAFSGADLAEALTLPEPVATLDVPIDHSTGTFDETNLAKWCAEHKLDGASWRIGSVHRGASERLLSWLTSQPPTSGPPAPPCLLTFKHIPIAMRVDEPARVGIDRLLAAFAANQLRAHERTAIVVDLGTAITVDVVEPDGAFVGGAILPGIGMAGRALAEQTDALPHVRFDPSHPPPPIGKSTITAIEAGLFWGSVGAIHQLINEQSADQSLAPDVFVTGGAGGTVAGPLAEHHRVRYEPHLVLSGIALVTNASGVRANDPRAES